MTPAERTKKWRADNPDKVKAMQKKYDSNRKDARRARELRTRYGITIAQYEALESKQGGRCAICGGTETGRGVNGHWAVDHNHFTGQVRALLCKNCNVGLGHFHDNPTVLRAAALYLENHNG